MKLQIITSPKIDILAIDFVWLEVPDQRYLLIKFWLKI